MQRINQLARSAHSRFCQVLPNKAHHGRAHSSKLESHTEWEQFFVSQLINVENEQEQKWMMACKEQWKQGSASEQIDMLEVYAQPNSRIVEEVIKQGGKADRFTMQHGDLSTFEGQVELIKTIIRKRPKNIWMAPECHPWCAWNRFNASKSTKQYMTIQRSRRESLIHLQLCSFICKLQVDAGRHFHLENPGTSDLWKQAQAQPLIRMTKSIHLDQCRFGLIHPEDSRPLKKYTRVQTTSNSMVRNLDGRICQKNHEHAQISGSCKFQGKRIALSRFAAFYPRMLAKAIVRGIIHEVQPSVIPIYPVEEVLEPQAKRIRTQSPRVVAGQDTNRKREHEKEDEEKESQEELTDELWKGIFEWCQNHLPKSGAQDLSIESWVGQAICLQTTISHVKQIRAGKGFDKFLIGNSEHPIRQTVCMCRKTKKIVNLGEERWTKLTLQKQRRNAIPSHIMIAIFGTTESEEADSSTRQEVLKPSTMPVSPESKQEIAVPESSEREIAMSPTPDLPVPAWTPQAVSNSGSKFEQLQAFQKTLIRRTHNNLGHPTSQKLSEHLRRAGMSNELVEGAAEYQCPSCTERVPPKLTTPGKLKEAREFNDKISIDGFEWKNEKGLKMYVIHIFDEATHYHLGKRISRSAESTEKAMYENWFSWAGPPNEICHDEGGEFMSQRWKDMLQREGIKPTVSAAPWQRGRIERHGAVIKEMLNRINQEKEIETNAEFDYALYQCFQAKNSMSVSNGYSPEQAVLGRARRLPGSICNDEDSITHSLDNPEDTRSKDFQERMQIRTLARKALLDADNSQAIRRAMLRQSRGHEHDWQLGELCMIWDKRKSPNMIEKGRWVGPCQVIMHEGRTIIWVTQMNRLLRVARENMRPVSLREFQSRSQFNQSASESRLQEMAQKLKESLKQRSGMFQYVDLSEPRTEEQTHPTEREAQPEEEPHRRDSNADSQHRPEISGENAEQSNPGAEDTAAEVPTGSDYGGIHNPESEQVGDSLMVHNAFITEVNIAGTESVLDEGTLWSKRENHEDTKADFCKIEFDVPKQQLTRFLMNPCLHATEIAKAAKKTHTEVQYSRLTKEEKQRFDQAKRKEMNCWLETSAVVPILKNRIHPSRIMSSRWILTWKTDPNAADGRKPKARIVVRGFEDPELATVSTESPTLSRDGRMAALQTIASKHWQLQSFDITTAFLRGRSDERQLAMTPVQELRELMHLKSEEVCLLKGNAYGRVDAPLLFYKEFRRRLEEQGFEAHPMDGCLFLLRNPTNPKILEGILGTHVDDGIGGGTKFFEEALERLQKHLPFGSREYRKFRFTGLDMEQMPDFSIRVSQENYVMKIDPIDVPKIRRKETETPANPHEVQQLRALCGSLQYAAVHSRPDMAAKVAFLQKQICKATIADLLEGNRILNEAKEFASTAIYVRPIPLEEITFASFGDASFASESKLKAQQGLFIMACTKRLQENKASDFTPIAWNSKQIGRVVRSTLSAEAYAMSSSLDKLTWIRCLWSYIHDPKFQWYKPEEALKNVPKALLITDCKSLYDLVTKLAVPNCQEWRTTIEVMLIKEQAGEHSTCRWISTAIMLADALTKPMDSTFMRRVLQLGRFRIYDEEGTLKHNANRKYGKTCWLEPNTFEQRKENECESSGVGRQGSFECVPSQ